MRDNLALAVEKRPNKLLSAIPSDALERWWPHLQLVELPLGHVIYESGGKLPHVYFPLTAIVSLLYVMEDGASAEIAVIGNDGVVGISLFMGGDSTTSRAVVQSAGTALQLPAGMVQLGFTRAEISPEGKEPTPLS